MIHVGARSDYIKVGEFGVGSGYSEAAAPEGVVMASFPTMEAARAFYDSPDYQAAVKHRFVGADYRSFIIEGIN